MTRNHFFLVSFAAIMIVILIFNGRPNINEDQAQTPVSSIYRLFDHLEDMSQIEWLGVGFREEEKAIGIAEDDQGRWYLLDDPDTFLDAESANFARYLVFDIQGFRGIERGTTPIEEFGILPVPQYVVRFGLRDGTTYTFYIGDKTPDQSAYYVSGRQDSAIIDLVSAEWIDQFIMLMRSFETVISTP